MTRRDRVIFVIGLGAVILVLVITLSPTPVDRSFRDVIAHAIDGIRAVPGWGWMSWAWLDRFANVLLFVPVGLVLIRWLPRAHFRWTTLATALLLSLGIELVQWVLLPRRTASISDVISNIVGVGGTLIVWEIVQRSRTRGEVERQR